MGGSHVGVGRAVDEAGLGFATYLRQVAAVGCAAVVTGALVAFPGGRLVMRLLALLNPEDTGQVTDDGFLVGRVSLGGSGQLLLAAVQISMLGAVVFLLVRPLLLGPRWLRTTTLAVGVATTVAALLVTPESFDFLVLEPRWLPIALFWLLPAVHVVVFATLAEHWLADDSWFARAPLATVRWTLLLWLLAGAALVLACPSSRSSSPGCCSSGGSRCRRRPRTRRAGPGARPWW